MPLHLKLEEKFRIQTLVPELERKKKVLADLRESFKPMDQTEILKHAEKYEKIRKQLMRDKKRERNINRSICSYQYHTSLVSHMQLNNHLG